QEPKVLVVLEFRQHSREFEYVILYSWRHNAKRVSLFSTKAFGACRLLAAFGLAVSLGGAAVLSIPGPSANAGQLVASSVTFAAEGSQVSSVQFDLEWDEGLEVQFATGAELLRSGKLIYS